MRQVQTVQIAPRDPSRFSEVLDAEGWSSIGAVLSAGAKRLNGRTVWKSLAEGFGLTVAEAMWKSRPVVASRVGGIVDQIVDGISGVLVQDPTDLAEFGDAVSRILRSPALGARIGRRARERVTDRFLATRSLIQYAGAVATLEPGAAA